ncbi:MAG: efflux RND transporter periplasmic adaptor subunit [Phycisphaerae bacterium]|nr:efflux RND transporter periplasmic adaptor subunit [Phycisphaerae bacterium]
MKRKLDMIEKLVIFAGVLSVALLSGTAAVPEKQVYQYKAIVRASEDITVSSTMPVRVSKVHVKDGDTVKPGQTLVQLDDKAERVQMAQLKAQAEDKTHVEAAVAQLDQKKLDLKRVLNARAKNAATELEEQHARLEVTISNLSLTLARFEHDQNLLKYKQAEVQVNRLRLCVPTSDKDKPTDTFKVFKVFVSRGESVDRLKEVIRIIKIDPLQIDVPVPEDVVDTLKLKVAQKAYVIFPKAKGPPAEGRIIYVADEIDAASGTQIVRVEIPNPSGRPAGKKVFVRFAPADKTGIPINKKGTS